MDTLLILNDVQTKVLTWGEPFNSKSTDVIICISGNPGVVEFYTQFAETLHKNTQLPVCVIGQAGHDEVPDKLSNQLRNQEHLFNLEGQTQHKLDLITKHIDKESKLHLIGHSIGSWLILELLQRNEKLIERVASVNLLFPTVQRMAESKSGRYLNNIFRKYHTILITLIYILLYIIPEPIARVLVNFYMKYEDLPQHHSKAIMKFLNANVIEKVLFLAYNEMDTVKALNNDIIEKIKGKTMVLYSPRDGWVPIHYMEDFRRFEPDLKLKEVNVEHAFVMQSSERIADIVSDFIITKHQTHDHDVTDVT